MAELRQLRVLELEAQLLGDHLGASQDSDVLEHPLAAVTEARRLDGDRGERAAQLVDHDRRERLALFFFNDTPTTEIYTLSLHDALPISLNVWSIHVSVRAPLLEDRGLVCNIERQTMRRVPHRDWLHEGPGGKLAVAHGTDASSVDARPHRIGNSHAEGESRLRLDVAKSNHRLPHTLWWRIDLDCGDRLEHRFRWRTHVHDRCSREQEQTVGQARGSGMRPDGNRATDCA